MSSQARDKNITVCRCSEALNAAETDLRNKAKASPALCLVYGQAAVEVARVAREHFTGCALCQASQVAA